jgi:hypothetical protein
MVILVYDMRDERERTGRATRKPFPRLRWFPIGFRRIVEPAPVRAVVRNG